MIAIGIGSNLGQKTQQITDAVVALQRQVLVTAYSAVYQSAPWGHLEQDDFYNCCVLIQTDKSAESLLVTLKNIEQQIGRTKTYHWGPRSIDLDLLIYHEELISTDTLSVPHARLFERNFVVTPLLDCLTDFTHPAEKGLSLKHSLTKLQDQKLSEVISAAEFKQLVTNEN